MPVVETPKQGFASPVPGWLKAGLDRPAQRLLCRPATLERGWWSAEGIERLLADPDRHGFRIYSLLMLELAVRIHVEGSLHAEPPTGGLESLADAV
jgi:asparagine synthase (glutamine-hydrolysing)